MDPRRHRQVARAYFREQATRGLFSAAEHYVPLRAQRIVGAERRSPVAGRGDERDSRDEPEPAPVLELLREPSQLRKVLIARPGAGKTCTLLAYARSLAEADDGPLPVYLRLRQLDPGYEGLKALLRDQLQLLEFDAELDDLRRHPEDFVLLLDGVNECSDAGDRFNRLIESFPATPMVFSTREPDTRLGEPLELLPFTSEERDATIAALITGEEARAGLRARLEADPRLAELASTPLLLALLCDVVSGGFIPDAATRTALLRASIRVHHDRYKNKAGRRGAHPEVRVDACLARLAHAMLVRGALQIPRCEAEDALDFDKFRGDPSELLRNLTTHHLLTFRTSEVVEFVHPLIHEHYAAEYLRERGLPPRREFIRVYLNRTLWTEPLCLYAEECADEGHARRMVEAATRVDDLLAARLIGHFPPVLQGALLRDLPRPSDTPCVRLARALAVGTEAAVPELARLIDLGDPELRYRIAVELWDFSGEAIAALNARLLLDPSPLVCNVAAHNLSRHPAPVHALLEASEREEAWQVGSRFPLPSLVVALMASDTDVAAGRVLELARRCIQVWPKSPFRSGDGPRISSDDPRAKVCDALRTGSLAARPARALARLLPEVDEDTRGGLIQILRRTTEIFDVDPVVERLPAKERREFVESCVAYPGTFQISDARLLEVVRATWWPYAHRDAIFEYAKERGCAGLAAWLAKAATDDPRDCSYYGGAALANLVEFDTSAAGAAVSDGLRSKVREVRHGVAVWIWQASPPALAEYRPRALEIIHSAPELMAELVETKNAESAAELLGYVFDQFTEAVRLPIIEALWRRYDVAWLLAELGGENKRKAEARRWREGGEAKVLPGPLVPACTRALLAAAAPLRDAFLRRDELWRGQEVEAMVVEHLEAIISDIEGQGREAVARALEHLSKCDWRMPASTLVRLLTRRFRLSFWMEIDADTDALFLALQPLLRGDDKGLQVLALEHLHYRGEIPPAHVAEYAALLEEPAIACRVARHLISARLLEYVPSILRRPELFHMAEGDTPRSPGAGPEARRRDPEILWRELRNALADASITLVEECLEIVAAREGPGWAELFLELFSRAPRVAFAPRVLVCFREHWGLDSPAKPALRALLDRVESTSELAEFWPSSEAPHDSDVALARLLAETTGRVARPLALRDLAALIESLADIGTGTGSDGETLVDAARDGGARAGSQPSVAAEVDADSRGDAVSGADARADTLSVADADYAATTDGSTGAQTQVDVDSADVDAGSGVEAGAEASTDADARADTRIERGAEVGTEPVEQPEIHESAGVDAKASSDTMIALAGWWARLLGRIGESTDAAALVRYARRTRDYWLTQVLYQEAAEISRRTGIYSARYASDPEWSLLHLSDLHFTDEAQAELWYSALAEDLRRELRVTELDAVVLSGDIVDRASTAGYSGAEELLRRLRREFRVARERIVIVPGNHDVDRQIAEAAIREVDGEAQDYDFAAGGRRYEIHDRSGYNRRLEAFADFFERALGRPYPFDPQEQALVWVWPELEVAVVGLSSVVELDGYRPGNAKIDDVALARAFERLRDNADVDDDFLKIAVVHHPPNSPDDDRIRDHAFLERLAVAEFMLLFQGHVHQAKSERIPYDYTANGRRLEVIGAGTFGARSVELPTGYPWQYSLLQRTGEQLLVRTRRREAENGPWKPHACWPAGAGRNPLSSLELDLSRG